MNARQLSQRLVNSRDPKTTIDVVAASFAALSKKAGMSRAETRGAYVDFCGDEMRVLKVSEILAAKPRLHVVRSFSEEASRVYPLLMEVKPGVRAQALIMALCALSQQTYTSTNAIGNMLDDFYRRMR